MKISKKLRMSISSVQILIKNWKTRDSVKTEPRSGRPTKMSTLITRKIVWNANKNPKITSAEIQDLCKEKWAAWSSRQKKAITTPSKNGGVNNSIKN